MIDVSISRVKKEQFYSYTDHLKLLAEVGLHHHVIILRQGGFEHCGQEIETMLASRRSNSAIKRQPVGSRISLAFRNSTLEAARPN